MARLGRGSPPPKPAPRARRRDRGGQAGGTQAAPPPGWMLPLEVGPGGAMRDVQCAMETGAWGCAGPAGDVGSRVVGGWGCLEHALAESPPSLPPVPQKTTTAKGHPDTLKRFWWPALLLGLEEEGPHIRPLHSNPQPRVSLPKGGAGSKGCLLCGERRPRGTPTPAWISIWAHRSSGVHSFSACSRMETLSGTPHFALSLFVASAQTLPCFSQSLTWHSLQAEESCCRNPWFMGWWVSEFQILGVPLTCGSTTHSGTGNSAWRPLPRSRRNGASLEPLPAAHPVCRSQPTWDRGQEGLSGCLGLVGGTGVPLPVSRLSSAPFHHRHHSSRPHLLACNLNSCSEGLNTVRSWCLAIARHLPLFSRSSLSQISGIWWRKGVSGMK